LNALGRVGAGIIAPKQLRESSSAPGVVIALWLGFLLNAAGGVMRLG
jgi:hypothetical protein